MKRVEYFYFGLIVLMGYFILFSVPLSSVLPGNSLFNLIVTWICAFIGHQLISKFTGLPGLVGSLSVGILLGNLLPAPALKDSILPLIIDPQISSTIRLLCFAVIMLRAGLGMYSIEKLFRNSSWRVMVLLIFLPNIIEATCISVLSKFILRLDWIWSWILGFGLAAISPAVLVPLMLDLQLKGYGEEKGIGTMLIASSSFDDILSVAVFTILLGFVPFASVENSLALEVSRPFIELFSGFLLSFLIPIMGWIFVFRAELISIHHSIFLLSVSSLYMLLGRLVGYQAAGVIGVLGGGWLYQNPLVLSKFARKLKLSTNEYLYEVDDSLLTDIQRQLKTLWDVLGYPLLFSLIGTSIVFRESKVSEKFNDFDQDIGQIYGILALVILTSLLIRCLVAFACSFAHEFKLRERVFIAVAWIPKATVQAALASVPLDLMISALNSGSVSAENQDFKRQVLQARIVLIGCVLAVLISAPLGSALITLLGPRFLERKREEEVVELDEHKNDSF